MSECDGDYKCGYCKGRIKTKPKELFGECLKSQEHDELQTEIQSLNQKNAELEADLKAAKIFEASYRKDRAVQAEKVAELEARLAEREEVIMQAINGLDYGGVYSAEEANANLVIFLEESLPPPPEDE